MYTPELAPVGASIVISALVASLPFLTVFLALGVLRWKAHWAGLSGLGVALLVAVFSATACRSISPPCRRLRASSSVCSRSCGSC